MNSLLALLLSGSIFLSSFVSALFSIPVPPFNNSSITTNGFEDAEAAVVYYLDLINNPTQLNVSPQDQLALKCTTAQIIVDYFSPSWSESTITSITAVYAPSSRASGFVYELKAILNSLAIAIDDTKLTLDVAGYLDNFLDAFGNANAISFSENNERYFGTAVKMIAYYYSLQDHLTFNDNDVLTDAAIEAAMVKALEAFESNKPYMVFSIIEEPNWFSWNWISRDLYDSFMNDLNQVSSEHRYYQVYLFQKGRELSVVDTFVITYVDDLYFVNRTNPFPFTDGNVYINLYSSSWVSSRDIGFKGKYQSTSNSDIVSVDDPTTYTFKYRGYTRQPVASSFSGIALNSLNNNLNDAELSSAILSRQTSGFVVFNDFESFKNYTIDSSLYFRADNPSYVIKGDYFNDLKYTEVNQAYYNSIKNYITTNNIQYVTNTAQNEFNTIYNNYTTIINNYVSPSGPGEGGGEGDGESTGLLQEISKKLSNIHTTMLIWMGLDQIDPPSGDGPAAEPEEGVSVFDFLLLLIYVAFFIVLLWKILKLAFSVLGWIVHLFNIEPYTDNLNSHFVDTFHFLRNDIQSYDLNGDPVYYFGIKEPIYILGTLSPFDFMVVIFEIAFVGVVFALVHRYVKDFNPNNLKG